MSIPATEAIGGPYVGDGIQVDFTFPFLIFADSDIQVTVNNGTTSSVISSSLYSVVINAVGGTVTLNDALTDTYKLAITRYVTFEQATNLTSGQAFFAETLEQMDDEIVMQTQELDQRIKQVITFDPTIETADALYSQLNSAVISAELAETGAETAEAGAVTAQGLAETAQGLAEDAQVAAELAASESEATALSTIQYGLILYNATDTEHDIKVTAGRIIDSTKLVSMALPNDMTKRIDANWVAGDGNGGFPSALTLANLTTYHLFLIKNPATEAVDWGFDTSLTAANLLADATGFTKYEWIGAVLTDGSANIIQFFIKNNYYFFKSTVEDLNTVDDTSPARVAFVTSVPAGIEVIGLYTAVYNSGGSNAVLFTSYNEDDQAPVHRGLSTIGDNSEMQEFERPTNLSSEIYYRSTHSGGGITLKVWCRGWKKQWS